MRLPDFEELPFNERPDLTPYLIHLTKNTTAENGKSAFDNLLRILETGLIRGSSSKKGFIKGPHSAACFMDVPFTALKYILNRRNSDPQKPRYEPFGIVVTKEYAYKYGCRPVLYLSPEEEKNLGIPKSELWRVVRFQVSTEGWISWLHEREWRAKGGFKLPYKLAAVLVKNQKFAKMLQEEIYSVGDNFRSTPNSIIPLVVVCQGLPYL